MQDSPPMERGGTGETAEGTAGGRWSPDRLAFVVLTHRGDAHYARALLASLRHFYPDHRVLLIVDGDLDDRRLGRYPNVEVLRSADLARDVGLPLTGVLSKLALLYRSDAELYAYFDADSVMVGRLFDAEALAVDADFYAIDGTVLDLDDEAERARFARYAVDPERVRATVDPRFDLRHVSHFSGGHYIMRAGSIPPATLEANLDQLSGSYDKAKTFHFNDQSYLNWVVNRLAADGDLRLVTTRLGISGRDTVVDHPDVTWDAVVGRSLVEEAFIHYVGPSRHLRFRDHSFSDILTGFRERYYADLPRGALTRDEVDRIARLYARRARKRVDGLGARARRRP